MKRPIRATYGAFDNMHKILQCDNTTIKLPTEIEGLTDRPPGVISPGEIWGPSVGCGPVANWWVLWWTQPDQSASRAGMVRSEVALWPLNEIDSVDDLTPILCELSCKDDIILASGNILAQVANTLLTSQGQAVVVCDNLNIWPCIIAGLWLRLWPEARMNFSARVALIPPQSNRSTNPPWIFGVPKSRVQQWQKPYVKVELNAEDLTETPFSRAAWYLAGRDDKALATILDAIPPQQSNLMHLRKAARVTDSLEKLQSSTNYEDALALLRTLNAMTTDNNDAKQFKELAINTIAQKMPEATIDQVLSIANIALPSIPSRDDLKGSLKNWVDKQVPSLSVKESTDLLKRLQPNKAQQWWQEVVLKALSLNLDSFDTNWVNVALSWLKVRDLESVHVDIFPSGETFERKLVEAANVKHWTKTELDQVRHQSKKRKWSVLHAFCLASSMSVSEAFDVQYKFDGKSELGLKYLVHHLPAEEVVKESIVRNDPNLFTLVSEITILNPELLCWIEVSKQSNRKLWAEHTKLGGKVWPDCFKAIVQGRELIDSITKGESSFGLVEYIAEEIVQIAIDHPYRRKLWVQLNSIEKQALLPLVAMNLIEQLKNNHTLTQPEPILVNSVIEILRGSQPSALVVCAVISWDIELDEYEVIKWVSLFTREEWRIVALTIGQAVNTRKWKKMASKLKRIGQIISEAAPAVKACSNLLPWWERSDSDWYSTTSSRKFALQRRVGEIGADLYPDALQYIWERAGGEIKNLKLYDTPRSCWQNAVSLAAKGALSDGLLSIVRELKKDFPGNRELMELEKALK